MGRTSPLAPQVFVVDMLSHREMRSLEILTGEVTAEFVSGPLLETNLEGASHRDIWWSGVDMLRRGIARLRLKLLRSILLALSLMMVTVYT